MRAEDVLEVTLIVGLMFALAGLAVMVVEYRIIQRLLRFILELYYSLPLSGKLMFVGLLTAGSGFVAYVTWLILKEAYSYIKFKREGG